VFVAEELALVSNLGRTGTGLSFHWEGRSGGHLRSVVAPLRPLLRVSLWMGAASCPPSGADVRDPGRVQLWNAAVQSIWLCEVVDLIVFMEEVVFFHMGDHIHLELNWMLYAHTAW